MVEEIKLAKASGYEGGEGYGSFMLPVEQYYSALGLTPEKLIVPKDYHKRLQIIYDFYRSGGLVSTVVNRLAELTITEIRNGQRKTTNEQNIFFDAVLQRKPSRMMRFLRQAALEYFLSGMVIPRIDYEQVRGKDLHPELVPNKIYTVPRFDLYPPNLVQILWAAGWGQKEYYLKVSDADLRLIRNRGSRIKAQQLKYVAWMENYPSFVEAIQAGADTVQLKDVDPILRKEISDTPYPTPYLGNVLEPLIFKQQLRRMDFAVASRIINAILLVQEGNDNFPLTEETRENLDELKSQILARQNNPRLMERLFILFSNHTTQLTWITPDVEALLNQAKYEQVDQEISEGLGFAKVLITGENRGTGNTSEISTWAIQPSMEELRSMLLEFVVATYEDLSRRNNFRNLPQPAFKPIRLQDFVKTASVFAQLFTEGNLSRTTRADIAGLDFETETELMRDERALMNGLDAFPAMPYSPPPPTVGGRPPGSSNVPINNRNTGIKPSGQKPVSRIKVSSDEEVIDLINKIALAVGAEIDIETIEETPEIGNE